MRFITLLVLTLMLVALGCGPQVQQAPSGNGDDQPKSGGAFINHATSEHEELDPTMAQQGGITFITPRAFDSLLDVKSGPAVGFNEWVIVPKLAERWEVSPDAKHYTFYLRKGVKFANLPPVNGRELTAADVKWSLEYIARIGQFKDVKFALSNQLLPYAGPLERVDVPDPSTVVVYMKQPFVPFLSYAAMPNLAIMPHEVYDQDGRFSDRPLGSGPWQWDKSASQAGTRMVYKKNPDYWQTGKPYVDEVRTVVLSDNSAVFAAFQTKQLDILNGLDLSEAEQLKQAAPNAPFLSAMGNHGFRIYYNHTLPLFTDVRFRRALSFATDREEFVKTFTKGEGQWGIDGGIPGLFTQEEAKKMSPYDPEEAKRLLRESGYADKPLTIEVLNSASSGVGLNNIELLQAQWKKVGIDIKIVPVQTSEASRRVRAADYMLMHYGTSAGDPEPDYYLYQVVHPSSAANTYHVKDPKLAEFAEAQRAAADPARRRALWQQQAKYVHEQGIVLWVYYAPQYYFQQPYVKGYYPSNPNRQKPTVDIWLDK